MSNSLYGVSVSSTFQRLVQIVDGLYYDGLGNLLNIGGTGGITVGPTGPQGPTGSPGTSLMWMGSWTQSMYYVSYDTVSYNGSSYICLVNNPQNAPGISSSEWDIIAQGFSNSYTNQTPFISVTQSYNISNSDYYIDCNGTFDVTLPTADKIGKSFIIKNNGTGIITIKTSSLELIDNLESFILAFYDTLHIQSDGNNWQIINPQTKQFIRIINNTGQKIYKGTVLKIKQSNSIIPEVELPISSGLGNQQVSGLAYTDIENNTEGLIISSGILSGLNLSNYNIGDILYLSDTLNGGLINSTTSLKFSSRTNQIGYVTNNTSDLGTIQVEIVNENINLSLTDIQRNILEGNVISTGTYEFLGLSVLSPTTFNISPMKGWIVNNTGSYSVYPSVNNVIFNGATGVSALNISTEDNTYVLIGASANIITQNTFPTPIQRRENIYLGKVIHPNRISIQNINNTVDYDVSPVSMIRDIWTPIKLINDGISITPNDGNLSINISSGYLWGNGINWINNQLNPNQIIFTSQTLATFQYRTSLGATATFINGATATFTNRNTLLVDTWESSPGVLSSVGTPNAKATNIRVYVFPTGLIRLQFGQHVYQNLTAAAASVNSESFNIYSNNLNNGILIGIISVVRNATNLSDPTQALFTSVSKFGEIVGGAAGGSSTINLQQAFNNSATNPDILTSDNNPSFILKNGDGSDNTNILIVQNLSGTSSFYVSGSGNVNATSFSIIGNTFSYFLKSNGTLDTNIYLTNNDLQPYALSSTLSNYYLASNPNGYITASSLLSYQPLLTNPIIGTGSTNQISYFVGTSSIVSSSNFVWDNLNIRLGIGSTSPTNTLTISSGSTGIVLYNTSDQTNYNRLRILNNNTNFIIASEIAGSVSTSHNIRVTTRSGNNYIELSHTTANSSAIFDMNMGSANVSWTPTFNTGNFSFRPIIRSTGIVGGTTNTQPFFQISPQWNGSGSNGYSALQLSVFESGSGTNTKLLIDAGLNTAYGGVGTHSSVFAVDSVGNIITSNTATSGHVFFNTSDQTTNFERGRIFFGGNNFNIGVDQGGSGTNRNMVIYSGSRVLTIYPSGNNGGFFNFNTTTSGTFPTIGITSILNGTNSQQASFGLFNTLQQSTSASYRMLWISPFEQTVGTGSRLLIDAGTNTANSGTGTHSSVFSVDSVGNIITSNTATSGHVFFNTSDQTTNFERARISWNSNIFEMSTSVGGTGAVRSIRLNVGGRIFTISNGAPNISGDYNFGSGTSNANSTLVGVNGSLAASSGVQNSFAILNNIIQSSTAGYRSLWISPFENTIGSGNRYLVDIGTNTAASGAGTHSSLFIINSIGNVLLGSNVDNGVDKLQVNGSIYSASGFETLGNVGIGTTIPTHSLTLASVSTGMVVYNTTDQSTNFERGIIRWNNNVFELGTNIGGTGNLRTVRIYTEAVAGSTRRTFDIQPTIGFVNSSHFSFNINSTSQIGSSVGILGVYTAASSFQQSLSIFPTINQSGSAGYRGIWISSFQQTIGTSNVLLIDIGLNTSSGGSGTHTSVFSVDINGNIVSSNNATGGQLFYNTTDQTINFERFRQFWSGNTYQMGLAIGGTATSRTLRLFTEAVAGSTQRQFDINPSNTGVGSSHFSFNNTVTGQPGSLFGIYGVFNSSAFTQNSISVLNTVNQSNTGSYRGIWVSPFLQTTGASTLLIDLGTNTAALGIGTHSSVFNINSLGNLFLSGTASFSSNIVLTSTASSSYIKFNNLLTGTPSYNNYSNGAKIILYDNISSSSTGMVIGVDMGTMWFGTDLTGNGFRWFAGDRTLATMIGSTGLVLNNIGSISNSSLNITGITSNIVCAIGISGTNTKGGAGYMDFLTITNTGATSSIQNKYHRLDSVGNYQILNSAYTSVIYQLSDSGILLVNGGNPAVVSNNDSTAGYLSFNNNNSQIYDDGNFHIHTRATGQSMWINTNGGPINLLTQSPVSGGALGTGIAIGGGTLTGFVTINSGKSLTTATSYGYLTTSGAGTYPGGSQTINVSLYATQRIMGQEIDAFSDERMKDIKGEISLDEATKLVNNIKPIKFSWKEGDDKGLKTGYSAQQVIKSGFDHLVSLVPKEGLDEVIDNENFLSPKDNQFVMNYDQVTPYHSVIIKNLLEKLEKLENKVNDLTLKNIELNKKIDNL